MDITYCYEKCDIGVKAGKQFLEQNESIFDAASDFQCFVENCFQACPYKNTNQYNNRKDS